MAEARSGGDGPAVAVRAFGRRSLAVAGTIRSTTRFVVVVRDRGGRTLRIRLTPSTRIELNGLRVPRTALLAGRPVRVVRDTDGTALLVRVRLGTG